MLASLLMLNFKWGLNVAATSVVRHLAGGGTNRPAWVDTGQMARHPGGQRDSCRVGTLRVRGAGGNRYRGSQQDVVGLDVGKMRVQIPLCIAGRERLDVHGAHGGQRTRERI